MLKIKDDVDLKELEKFGFQNEDTIYCGYNVFDNYMIMIHKDNKRITTRLDTDFDDLLFDLIQLGLVEKI